jgi:hypothetical protein
MPPMTIRATAQSTIPVSLMNCQVKISHIKGFGPCMEIGHEKEVDKTEIHRGADGNPLGRGLFREKQEYHVLLVDA